MEKVANPLSLSPTSKKVMIVSGVALVFGAAYYYLAYGRDKPTGLKITGYENVTQESGIVTPGITLSSNLGDVIRIYVEFNYFGKQQTEVDIHVATRASHGSEVTTGNIITTIPSSNFSKTYRKVVDISLTHENIGEKYDLIFKLKNFEGQEYSSELVANAVLIVEGGGGDGGGEPAPTHGFWNYKIIPDPANKEKLEVGDVYKFSCTVWYRGPTHEFDYKFELGQGRGEGDISGFEPEYYSGEDKYESIFNVTTPNEGTPVQITLGPFAWHVPQKHLDNHPGQNMDIKLDLSRFWMGWTETPISYIRVAEDVVPLASAVASFKITPPEIRADDTLHMQLAGCSPNMIYNLLWQETGATYQMETDKNGFCKKDIPHIVDPVGIYTVIATPISGTPLTASYEIIPGGELSGKILEGTLYKIFGPIDTWYEPLPCVHEDIPGPLESFEVVCKVKNTSAVTIQDMGIVVTEIPPSGSGKETYTWRDTTGMAPGEETNPNVVLGGGHNYAGRWSLIIRLVGKRYNDWPEEELAYWDTYFDIGTVITPSVTINNPVLFMGESLSVSWAGFDPNEPVYFIVNYVGGKSFISDSSGGGSGLIDLAVPGPGHYMLLANDGHHYVETEFTVQEITVPAYITIHNPILLMGESLSVSWAGFNPNEPIYFAMNYGGGSKSFISDSSGGGSGLIDLAVPGPGTFAISATDGIHYDEKEFTVQGIPASISINTPVITFGNSLAIMWIGFTPNAALYVSVTNGGSDTFYSDQNGDGTAYFDPGVAGPGTYILSATDGQNYAEGTFQVVQQGPQFPAPGTPGDGNYWYWLVFLDGSVGWFIEASALAIMNDPFSYLYQYFGPYPSGATS